MITQKRPFGIVNSDGRKFMYKAKLSVLAYRLRDFLGCHADKDGYVHATQQEIADELECAQTHLSTAFAALYRVQYVRRVKNGVYRINPEFERFSRDIPYEKVY